MSRTFSPSGRPAKQYQAAGVSQQCNPPDVTIMPETKPADKIRELNFAQGTPYIGLHSYQYFQFLENSFICDMIVMDNLEQVKHQLGELFKSAKERATNLSGDRYNYKVITTCLVTLFSDVFSPQDQLFIRELESCQENFRSLYRTERERYRAVGYGCLEKSRRNLMISEMADIQNKLDKMMSKQYTLLS